MAPGNSLHAHLAYGKENILNNICIMEVSLNFSRAATYLLQELRIQRPKDPIFFHLNLKQ